MSRIFFLVFISALLLFSCFKGLAQNFPVYNSYCVNPYLYNPAEAATNYTYVFLNYRRQWLGIEGSPVLYTLNVNTLLNERRAGVGFKVSSYKRGLLTSTDLLLTYAYGVSINQKNTLFFGLSGGAISNTIDVNKATDPNDPALALYQANNMQPIGNFGIAYKSTSGINLGITLPQLFAPSFNAADNFSQTAFSPLDNIIVTAYYKRKVEGKIVSRKKKGVRAKVKTHESNAPLEFYVTYKYAKAGNSQFEVLGKLNLSEHFWLGASYRQSYGFTGLTGFAFERFLLSYSYELGGQPDPGFSTGTHEIQLGLRLGKLKKFKHVAPVLRSTLKTGDQQHIARFQQTVEDTDHIDTRDTEKKKYYVVIKAFADFTGADVFKKKLLEQKYNADIFYFEKEKKYYVFVLETGKSSEAYEEVRNLKNYTKLKDARVLTVVTPK